MSSESGYETQTDCNRGSYIQDMYTRKNPELSDFNSARCDIENCLENMSEEEVSACYDRMNEGIRVWNENDDLMKNRDVVRWLFKWLKNDLNSFESRLFIACVCVHAEKALIKCGVKLDKCC